jgi:uncharacterized protein
MRYLDRFITRDLGRKMVFVAGPRQVGKTTLSLAQIKTLAPGRVGRYFNWDFDLDRRAILAKQWTRDTDLLVFDELHKYPDWKNWLKGLSDVRGVRAPPLADDAPRHQILVTGSAQLDVYRDGGDSMLGRYHHWRLHPFSLDELPSGMTPRAALDRLLRFGGFPEPFLADDEREARRWRNARFDRVLQEDVRDLESIKNIQKLRLFLDLLRERVGGLVVPSNLARDVGISPTTAAQWLQVLERMYLCFAIYPEATASATSLQKPPKVYFFDNADVLATPTQADTSGATFENLVATHLLKRLHFLEDEHGHRCALRYLRDREGREVDFAVFVDGQLTDLIEVKTHDSTLHKPLRYFGKRLRERFPNLRLTQIVRDLEHPYDDQDVRVCSPLHYFVDTAPWHATSIQNSQ